jgi:tetratricopeptide (TPR) repeat protein
MLVFVVFIFCFSGCAGPAGQAIKRGDELTKVQNYYGANREFVSALGFESDNKDARTKLCQFAKQGYEQELAVLEGFERNSDFETALKRYRELSAVIDTVSRANCLTFPVVNFKQKVEDMQKGASEAYYKEAEILFAKSDLDGAIGKYNEALGHNNPYKDAREKVAECYYLIGKKNETSREFRTAAGNYQKAVDTVSNYKDCSKRICSIYSALGDYYFSKGKFRNAVDDYSLVVKTNPAYANISDRLGKAESAAVTKVAFARFDNPTGKSVAGASMADLVFDELTLKVKSKASRFLKIVEREELGSILAEQKLGAKGLTDEFNSFKTMKGVNFLLFGKLSQINLVRPHKRVDRVQSIGKQDYQCRKVDRKGRAYEGTCVREVRVQFGQVYERVSLTLSGSMKVVDVGSGENIIPYAIGKTWGDEVSYATDFNQDISSVAVDESIVALSKERQNLASDDDLLKSAVRDITDDMAQIILDKLDRTPDNNDPKQLSL